MLSRSPMWKAGATALSLIITVALVLATFIVYVPQASAAVNRGINVTITSLEKSIRLSGGEPGQVFVGEYVEMSFVWDATNANPQPQDQFTIQLPSEFVNHHFGNSVSLKHAGATVGECQIDQTLITCTFNDGIAGHQNVRGDGNAVMRAVKATTDRNVTFNANGQTRVVPTPGNEPIGLPQFNSTPFYKNGEEVAKDATSLKWSIGFGGRRIKEEYFPQGGHRTIVFDDVITDGHVYDDSVPAGQVPNEDNYPYLVAGATATDPLNWAVIANEAGPVNTTWGTYSISKTVSHDKKNVRFSLTGDWRDDVNYIFYYKTKPQHNGGKVKDGYTYENSVTLVGPGITKTADAYYADAFSITIKMEKGFGSFKVQKALNGPAANLVPAGTKFPVKVHWTLPAGTTAATYNNWTPPANPFLMEVEAGKVIQPNVVFPVGTQLTFSEDTAAIADSNVVWGTPEFSPRSLVVKDQRSALIELTNTANPKPEGTFKIRKTVAGVAAGDKQFRFSYECSNGERGDLAVPADGTEVSPQGITFPVGTTCTISEDGTDAGSKYPNHRLLVAPQPQTVTVRDAGATEVASFTNTYEVEKATFSLKKTVAGEAPQGFNQAAKKFTVNVTCGTSPAVAVELPGDGSVVDYPHQVPVGTVCTVVEQDANGAPAPYTNVTSYSTNGQVTIAKGQKPEMIVTNTYTLPKGSFAVKKTVVGDNNTAQNKNFTFNYSCVNSATNATETGTLNVPGNGNTVPAGRDFPIGTVCTVTEDAASAALAGYTHTPVAPQEVRISADSASAPLAFVNTYNEDRGTLKITKKVLAEAGIELPAEGFPIGYSCTDGSKGAGRVTENQPFVSPSIKAGAVCTVTEGGAEIVGYTLATTYTVLPEGTASSQVTIVKDQEAKVEVKNEYTPKKGAFSVTKTVQGDAGALVADKDYEFEYVCVDRKGKQTAREAFTLKNGQVKQVTDVREGTCTVTEKNAGVANADLTTVYLIDGTNTNTQEAQVTVRQGATPAIAIRNTYSLHRGDFGVVKTVAGEDAATIATDKQFSFSYTCSEGTKGVIDQVKGDGKVKAAGLALPVGTTCEVSEVAQSAAVDQYDVAISAPVTVTIGHNTVVEAAFTNTYTHHYGTFSVTKTLKGAKDPAKVFTFNYTCTDGAKGTVEAKGDGVAVEAGAKFRTGTSCTVTEDVASAAIEGYTLTAPKPVTLQITEKDQVVGATFVNTYTEDLGNLVLSKALVAEAGFKAPADGFNIAYSCTDSTKGVKKIADKESVTIRGIKAKAVCTISEVDAERAGYDLTTSFTVLPQKEESAEVTIVKDQDATVQVTNTYVRHVGTFSLVKTMKGANDPAKVFTFDYVCTDGTKGSLKAKGDGVAVDSGLKLPTGTSCTITEDAKTAEIRGYKLTAAAPITITISEKDQQVVANFVNTYTEVPNPKIARTGADTTVLALAAGLTLLLGGAAIAIFRRKA